MIYVSTGGVGGQTAAQTAAQFLAASIHHVELSGGRHAPSLLQDLQAMLPAVRFQVHNYFPPPADPFVLNLGSLDPTVGQRSIDHVETALQWCQALGGDSYSFHAGFLLDPKVDQLGKRIPSRELFNRQDSISVFIERVTRLSKIAEAAGIRLMIENNVLSARNAEEFAENPLLMCDPDECKTILALLPDAVRLLIDVAHLKVSAQSLKFNPAMMFKLCGDRISGHHLSDNNGLEDSNKPFDEHAWFWPYLNPKIDYYSVEVYGCAPAQLLDQVNLVQAKIHQVNPTD